jgi:hypothetical protein
VAYLDMVSELAGTIPGLPPSLCLTHINRAWRDVRQARLWSFQVVDVAIVCPAQITAGTVTLVQYSPTVTLDAPASAAVTPFLISAGPTLQQLQIRFGGFVSTTTVGPLYQILSVNATVPTAIVLTLDRPVVETSGVGVGYQIYRAYVNAPVADFQRWTAIQDMANGYTCRLDLTSTYFDSIDPQRSSQGLAYFVGAFQNESGVQPLPGYALYEFWPHPVMGQTFYAQYRRRTADLSPTNPTQPDVIPDQLIVDRALGYYAYPWAQTNMGRFPPLAKVNWSNAIKEAKDRYLEAYRDVKRIDDDVRNQSILARGHGLREGRRFPYPLDSNFLQAHLVNF